MKYLLFLSIFGLYTSVYGELAGGRPNTFSQGNNAFAGVVNPANAVWIADRFDVGVYWAHQNSNLTNHNNNPLFPPGTTDFAYKSKNLFTADFAILKHLQLKIGDKSFDSSVTLATYTLPTNMKLRTKEPIHISGTTPVQVRNKTDVISAIFSLKLTPAHSIGFSVNYLYFMHRRDGFQNSDNPLRSVSPGHVTNNGTDHSSGIGCTLGWRWNITEKLLFGTAWTIKSYCGQYRKYRGFEPHHAENYNPQALGGGFSYRFTTKLVGKLEVLWTNLGNLPSANNNVLPNGKPNLNKRGSRHSPGPGQQDATLINLGMGYKLNDMLAIGAGLSHRIKLSASSNFLSHTYRRQTIYDIFSLGANVNHKKHDLFFVFSYGFLNRVSGDLPTTLGGGRFTTEKRNLSLSVSWGYKY